MKKYLIIYHVEDNDGVCSAAIILHYLLTNLHIDRSEIDLLGSTYNSLNKIQEIEKLEEWPNEYNHIIMTDISFNDWKAMKFLHKTFGNNFTWIDHHAPIIKLSKEHDFDTANGIRDTAHSAIWHAYKYLYDPFLINDVPFVVRMLSAWDSWSYGKEGIDEDFCRALNKGFTVESNLSVNWYLDHINTVLGIYDDDCLDILQIGQKICEKEDNDSKELIRTNGDKTWTVDGIPAIMVVTTGPTNSLMFKSLKVKNPTADDLRVAAVFKHCSDGKWVLSLYNIYDFHGDRGNELYFHCGEYLQKKYNGGGHEGAAGCTIDIDRLYLMLKSKKI